MEEGCEKVQIYEMRAQAYPDGYDPQWQGKIGVAESYS